jgi:glycosyltransferase involved in cell wall biosynthesis
MLALHRAIGTWDRAVDVFITPSEFTARRLVSLGLQRAALLTKANFLAPDPGAGRGGGGYALFVGRLSPEKGLETLVSAWRVLGGRLRLQVVGTGPLAAQLAREAAPGVELLGQRSHGDVLSLIADASCLVVPSLWFEGLPRVVIEAYARGTPVVASRIGALEESVRSGSTGELFRPGDADDLVRAVRSLLGWPDRLREMRLAARKEYEEKYTAERNHEELMKIYELAKARRTTGP